ncbi:complement C5 [Stegastes partitus]|uniref:Complement C5 n=1 Tax=Stegastes partitus TaxID=144197 RepID=A0A9Y4NKM8_9TELE|nr:PREDICTED: complement C5 [Stegastes partitus]
MKVCVVLLSVLGLCWRTEADSRSYLITAPLSLRLDAVETVLLQLFGFTDEVIVHVFLKTSMAPDHVVLAREVVTLNAQNNHQAAAKVRLFPRQLDKSVSHVILHVQSTEINQHLSIAVSRSNGFLFIQTDKPLYTPHQSVKVRAFSLNQELRPANRSVFLTFKDPDQRTVDIVEIIDVNNGIPSMQNPFKIPIKPKLGIWSIEASYSDDFTTTARTDFEVKEYVLPSFSIHVQPEANYISHGSFNRFSFKVSARYLHGAPVANAEVFLRYGYVSGKNPPVIIPQSITRERLSSSGEVDMVVNMQKVLSKHEGPKDLNGVVGQYLYIAVLLEESTGGISQEAEFAAVKFVKSPYRLSLVSTPPFIKPGLPYNIQVLVKDHLDQPVNRVPVRLIERQLFQQGGQSEEIPCPDSANSQSDGLAVFICNTPAQGVRAVLKFETADGALPAASQATLTLEASAYHSPNQRYLYIDTPLPGRGLEVGHYANIKVYSATPAYLPIKALSYLVLSKGKVVDFGSRKFVSSADNKQTLSFEVTPAMAPSIRLLVYYILYGEGTSELVADSVWLDVKDRCVHGLQTEVSLRSQNHKPKQNLQLNVRTNQNGLLALSAVDSALFMLRPKYRDPVTTVLRHIEQSDQGCGGGGGRDSADVFRLAGLTFMTNANAQPTSSSEACTAAVRPKRALTEEAKNKKAASYGSVKTCCEQGMRYIPKSVTCLQFAAQTFRKLPRCRQAFRECCEFVQQHLAQDQNLYCVTLAVGPALCLLQSQPSSGGLRSTACRWSELPAGGVGRVTFTLLGLEPGEHSLTFTLKTRGEARDVLQKKLRVVPEGVRQEVYSGGRLDPQGLYGSEKRTVELKNQVPANMVPNTAVERMLTINGEILGEVLTVMHNPEGLRQLVNLPAGSAEAELGGLLLLVQVYQYLETSRTWNVLGGDVQKNAADLKQRIREGLVSISSFRTGDSSYSMWVKRESSTWLTAQVVRTLSAADQLVSVDHQSLSDSVAWLIRKTQQQDGSFTDKSSFKANKVMAEGTTAVERSVYLTSFVLIALHTATRIKDPILQLQYHDNSMNSAANYISQHASQVKSVYVKAVATYALTLHDPNSMSASLLLGSLENLARQKGHPAELRYWQESSVTADWLKPDQSSGLTVETTAYVLLSVVLKGRIQYANPILSWLTQDQHYGEGFYSAQDTALTLEALREYSKVVSRAVLNQDINIRYSLKGSLDRVQLSQSRPVATPIQVTKNDDITVSTGYGRGVSNVKMKTVFYQTTASTQARCNFDTTIEVAGPGISDSKYQHTWMSEGQFRDAMEPVISHYELQGNTVVIQMDAVPSDIFLCVGFRIRTGFSVSGASEALFTISEPQDKGSLCSKQFSYQQQRLQRLCVAEQCQCMTAACAAYRGNLDVTLTAETRTEETCRAQIKYAYRVTVKSSAAEGDFMSHTATVVEVLKNSDKDLEAVSSGTEVDLVKKATCSGVDLQKDKQYLVMGSSGSEVKVGQSFRYRLPLDSDALVELWPTDCSSPECRDYTSQLEEFALDLQLTGCP